MDFPFLLMDKHSKHFSDMQYKQLGLIFAALSVLVSTAAAADPTLEAETPGTTCLVGYTSGQLQPLAYSLGNTYGCTGTSR